MDDPPLFKRLGRLYFAAASFSEAARRLGRTALAPGFLLSSHPAFGPELSACASLAAARPEGLAGAGDLVIGLAAFFFGSARRALERRIDAAIEPFDTAGLLDASRRDWYPVRADDLLASAAKFDATREEVLALLARTGMLATRHRH